MAAIDDDLGDGRAHMERLVRWEDQNSDSSSDVGDDVEYIESDDELTEEEYEKQQVEEFDALCREVLDVQIPFAILQLIVCEYCRPTLLLWDPDYCSWGAPSREYLSRVDFPRAAHARSRGRMRSSQRKRVAVGMHEFEAGFRYEIKMRLVCGTGQHPFTSVGVIPHDFTFISNQDFMKRYVEKPFFWRDFRGQDCDISLDFTERTMRANGGLGTVKFSIIADVPTENYFEFQTPENYVCPPVKIFTTWSSGGGWARIDEVYEEKDESYTGGHGDSGSGGARSETDGSSVSSLSAKFQSFRSEAFELFDEVSKQQTFKYVFVALCAIVFLQLVIWFR